MNDDFKIRFKEEQDRISKARRSIDRSRENVITFLEVSAIFLAWLFFGWQAALILFLILGILHMRNVGNE
jgi:hypothetical protein